MIPLDKYQSDLLSLENASRVLSEDEYKQFLTIPQPKQEAIFTQLLEKPITDFTIIHELYFRSKWAKLFFNLYQNHSFHLLEVASGDADLIPQCLSHTNPNSTYITANMNQKLNESLLKKLSGLSIQYQLIDDDALKLSDYLEKDTVDIIAFQHGLNDVLQAILCGYYGIDTTNIDWMELLPKMIELLNTEIKNATFYTKVYEPLLNLLSTLSKVLKPNGVIAINHYMFQLDLDLGYPTDLFTNLIPIVRSWLENNKLFKEITFEGFSSQWWLFLQKQ